MGNIDFFRKELAKSLKYHLRKEFGPRALRFVKDELNILLERKIKELNTTNDNTVKPQHVNRKGKNPNSTKRIR